MVHSSVTGQQPVSCSATKAPEALHTYDGKQAPEVARPLTREDIARILNDYENAARNALQAGFDGVQIHAANGYLIDEFLRDGTNHRSDEYGGSPENRTRFLREVTERVTATIGADKTSVRLSPNGDTQGCIDSHPEQVFVPAAKLLNDLDIAFLELREPGPNGTFGKTDRSSAAAELKSCRSSPVKMMRRISGESCSTRATRAIRRRTGWRTRRGVRDNEFMRVSIEKSLNHSGLLRISAVARLRMAMIRFFSSGPHPR